MVMMSSRTLFLNILTSYYALNTKIEVLDHSSKEFNYLFKYILNTNGGNMSLYTKKDPLKKVQQHVPYVRNVSTYTIIPTRVRGRP